MYPISYINLLDMQPSKRLSDRYYLLVDL